MDEFELIGRCFRGRTPPRPDTILGIGDDAAVLDTGGLPLVNARATTPWFAHDDAGAVAGGVFGTAFLRLAARAVVPRWATLGLTLKSGDIDRAEAFSTAVAEICRACGVELIGGDTTRGSGGEPGVGPGGGPGDGSGSGPAGGFRGSSGGGPGHGHGYGPGRATVFALARASARPRRTTMQPPIEPVTIRLPLTPEHRPAHTIAALVSVCTDLAARGAEIRCDDPQGPSAKHRSAALELIVRADAAGRADALRVVTADPYLEIGGSDEND